ncbi:MAG: hypothetical protein AAFW46_01450 [Pseudomonadota bacterium]
MTVDRETQTRGCAAERSTGAPADAGARSCASPPAAAPPSDPPRRLLRAVIPVVGAALAWIGEAARAAAQATGGTDADAFPDAQERAARDWDAMTRSVNDFWAQASETLDPLFGWVDETLAAAALAAAIGAYLGGYLGSRRRARRTERDALLRPPAPPSFDLSLETPARRGLGADLSAPEARREPMLADDRAAAPAPIRFNSGAGGFGADEDEPPRTLREAFEAPAETVSGVERRTPLEPTHGPLSEDLRERLDEAERLFGFFRERFGIEDDSADGAIAYLARLGKVVEGQRNELEEARKQLERLRRGGAGAAEDAAWDLVAEAGRAIRGAGQALRGDPDFADFVREARLEDALRRLAALRAARIERGERVRPDLAEQDWPHDLFRAEALASAYYPTYREWRDLRFGLTLAAACLRHLLRREGVFVGYVRLLSPMSQGEGEVWSENARGLRELAPVRRAVQATAASGAEAFVVDCETFGYFDAERDLPVRSRLIVYDRAEWR